MQRVVIERKGGKDHCSSLKGFGNKCCATLVNVITRHIFNNSSQRKLIHIKQTRKHSQQNLQQQKGYPALLCFDVVTSYSK
eukprot:356766-Ditylum_brightwellii.AAC.1